LWAEGTNCFSLAEAASRAEAEISAMRTLAPSLAKRMHVSRPIPLMKGSASFHAIVLKRTKLLWWSIAHDATEVKSRSSGDALGTLSLKKMKVKQNHITWILDDSLAWKEIFDTCQAEERPDDVVEVTVKWK
jgi:hypothetical protein